MMNKIAKGGFYWGWWRGAVALGSVGLFAFSFVGCSSRSQGEATASPGYSSAAGGVSSAVASYAGSGAEMDMASKAPVAKGVRNGGDLSPAIVKTASLTVRAKKVEETERIAASTAKQFGGMVVGSDGTLLASATPSVTLLIRIPQSRFAEAIPAFEALGQRLEKSIHADDVASQLTDTSARINSLLKEEQSLNQLIGQARRLADMITLRDRLTQIRSEIESLAATQRNLQNQVAYSTLALNLVQNPPTEVTAGDPGWFNVAFSNAVQSAGEWGRSIVVLLINVAVFLPFWAVPVAVAFAVIYRRRAKVQ